MRKTFAAVIIPLAVSLAPSYAQTNSYSINDLGNIMREKGDGICKTGCVAYVSANGWLYDVRFHSDYPEGRLFIAGMENRGKYPTLNAASVDDAEVKKIFDTLKNFDLMARSFGPEIGDESDDSSANEYIGFRDKEFQVGRGISQEYKEAYKRIINDITTAIVKSKR